MPETEYVTRREYEEHEARVHDENERQNHRISELEKGQASIHELVTSVKVMAVNMGNMTDQQKETNVKIDDISKRVKTIEEQPAKKWEDSKSAIWHAVLGAIGGALAVGLILLLAGYIK